MIRSVEECRVGGTDAAPDATHPDKKPSDDDSEVEQTRRRPDTATTLLSSFLAPSLVPLSKVLAYDQPDEQRNHEQDYNVDGDVDDPQILDVAFD